MIAILQISNSIQSRFHPRPVKKLSDMLARYSSMAGHFDTLSRDSASMDHYKYQTCLHPYPVKKLSNLLARYSSMAGF